MARAARLETGQSDRTAARTSGVPEAAGRFVENQDAANRWASRRRAISTSCCAAGGKRGRPRVLRCRMVVVTELAQGIDGDSSRMARARWTTPCRTGSMPQHDVLHHAEMRRQRQLLVESSPTPARRGVERIARRVRPRRPSCMAPSSGADRFRQGSPSACSLPAPFLADERADLAGVHRQGGTVGARRSRPNAFPTAPHLEARPRLWLQPSRQVRMQQAPSASGSFMCSRRDQAATPVSDAPPRPARPCRLRESSFSTPR